MDDHDAVRRTRTDLARMKRAIAVALALCAPWPLAAQNAITQEGTVLQNSPMMFRGNNRARQGAPAQGAPKGQIAETGDAVVGGRCDYSAPTDTPDGYSFVCIDGKGNSVISGGTKFPSQPFTIVVNGTRYEMPFNVAIIGSDAIVGDISGLKAAVGAAGKRMTRLGYNMPGDGGLAMYNWATVNCAAADNGAQVQPTGVTGCWIADFSGTQPTPMVWGARGNGTIDDTAAVQAAINAMQGKAKILYLGPFRYLIGAQLNVSDVLNIVGEGVKGDTYASTCPTGSSSFIINSNINALSLTAKYAGVKGVCFQMGTAPGQRTAGGVAISAKSTTGNGSRNDIIDNTIIYSAKGIYLTGLPGNQNNGSTIRGNLIISPSQIGISIGAESTGAGTVGTMLSDNQIVCHATIGGDATTANAYGLFVYDGAVTADMTDNGPYGCNVGTSLEPGANQLASGSFSGVLGDSSKTADLYIGPKTAGIATGRFVNFWVSNAAAGNTTDRPIWITTYNGGTVKRLLFSGGQVHSNYGQTSASITVDGASDVLFDGIMFHGNGPESVIGPAYDIINSYTITLSGNHIPGDYQAGIRVYGAGTNGIGIVGNTNFGGRPFAIDTINPNMTMVIKDNIGPSMICANLTTANDVTFTDATDCYKTVGAGEIWTMAGGWGGRDVMLLAGASLVLHNNVPLNGVCRPNLTMVAGDSIRLRYNASDKCWMQN